MNDELKIYTKHLIGRIYKILPLYETQNKVTIKVYCNSLLLNLSSADRMFNGQFIEVLIKINELNFDTMEHNQIRKIVLEAINIVQKMQKDLGDNNGNIS